MTKFKNWLKLYESIDEQQNIDFERYKGTIQHELQHLVNRGTNTNYSQDNLLLRTMEYQCHPGEIYA